MLDTFLTPESYPFALALALTAGLFLLEIVSLLLGATILGLGGEGPDIDVEADFDLSVDIDTDGFSMPADGIETPTSPSGLLSWLGIRDVPFLIWLVSFLTMFGLIGLIIQSIATNALCPQNQCRFGRTEPDDARCA